MCFLIQGLANLKEVAATVNGVPSRHEFSNFSSLNGRNPNQFKRMEQDGKVFPGSFSPVAVQHNKEILVLPMRYRVRPAGSLEEVPSKYNVFNARKDSLLKRKTWSSLIGRNHGIFVMKKFYEWVEGDDHKKKLVGFHPTRESELYVPCLYDKWIDNSSGLYFYSFAVITDDPPQEVEEAGHDRCPIHLPKENIKDWLNTREDHKFDYWNNLLGKRTSEHFDYVEDYQIQKKKTQDKQLKLF
jgi:putative SOS response-associated peptidase YedK